MPARQEKGRAFGHHGITPDRREGMPIMDTIFKYVPPVVKMLAEAVVLYQVSMGMGKIRLGKVKDNGDRASNTPNEPFIRENPGPHARVNNEARKTEFSQGVNCGRRWRRDKKRKG